MKTKIVEQTKVCRYPAEFEESIKSVARLTKMTTGDELSTATVIGMALEHLLLDLTSQPRQTK